MATENFAQDPAGFEGEFRPNSKSTFNGLISFGFNLILIREYRIVSNFWVDKIRNKYILFYIFNTFNHGGKNAS